MGFQLHIAGRYLRSKRHIRLINIIMLVSFIGIAVGVAALVVVMSVFNGFNGVVTSVLIGFDPHIRIEPSFGRVMAVSGAVRSALESEPEIAAWAPYVQGKGILASANVNRVVYVKGVDSAMAGSVSGVSDRIILGSMSFRDSLGREGIVLGMNLADRLGAGVGAELMAISPVGVDAMVMQMGQPYMKKCRVTGIYDSNNKEYDAQYAYVSLALGRRMFDLRNGVSGIEIRLHDFGSAERVKGVLQKAIGGEYSVSTWYDLHQELYGVMRVERWGAYVILCLIIAVAMFNVLGSLTMGVTTKKRDIGILTAMGATPREVSRIFLLEGVLVGLVGTLLGVLVGLIVCYLQIEYQIYPLDPRVYIIPALPVEVHWNDVGLIVSTSVIFAAIASWIPAARASQLVAVDAIRWE